MAQTFNVGYKTFVSLPVVVDDVGVAVDFSSIPDQMDALAWVSVESGGQYVGLGSTGVVFSPLIPAGVIHGPVPVTKESDMVLIVASGTQNVTVSVAIPG